MLKVANVRMRKAKRIPVPKQMMMQQVDQQRQQSLQISLIHCLISLNRHQWELKLLSLSQVQNFMRMYVQIMQWVRNTAIMRTVRSFLVHKMTLNSR